MGKRTRASCCKSRISAVRSPFGCFGCSGGICGGDVRDGGLGHNRREVPFPVSGLV